MKKIIFNIININFIIISVFVNKYLEYDLIQFFIISISENPVIKNQLRNKDTYQSKGVKIYEYTSSNSNSMNSLNLKQ